MVKIVLAWLAVAAFARPLSVPEIRAALRSEDGESIRDGLVRVINGEGDQTLLPDIVAAGRFLSFPVSGDGAQLSRVVRAMDRFAEAYPNETAVSYLRLLGHGLPETLNDSVSGKFLRLPRAVSRIRYLAKLDSDVPAKPAVLRGLIPVTSRIKDPDLAAAILKKALLSGKAELVSLAAAAVSERFFDRVPTPDEITAFRTLRGPILAGLREERFFPKKSRIRFEGNFAFDIYDSLARAATHLGRPDPEILEATQKIYARARTFTLEPYENQEWLSLLTALRRGQPVPAVVDLEAQQRYDLDTLFTYFTDGRKGLEVRQGMFLEIFLDRRAETLEMLLSDLSEPDLADYERRAKQLKGGAGTDEFRREILRAIASARNPCRRVPGQAGAEDE